MKALLVRPVKFPKVVDVEDDCTAISEAVGGGLFEVVRCFDDNAVIVCNDEGIIKQMQPNRAIMDEEKEGMIKHLIFGDFLIVGTKMGDEGEEFTDLSDDQAEKYEKRFHEPEGFLNSPFGGIIRIIGTQEFKEGTDFVS